MAKLIDWLFTPWERDHCRRAREKDIERAKQPAKESSTGTPAGVNWPV